MLIVEKLSEASPSTHVYTPLGIDVCLALSTTDNAEDGASPTARARWDLLPGWATDLHARIDRLLPGWPKLLIDSYFRMEAPSNSVPSLITSERARIADEMSTAHRRAYGSTDEDRKVGNRCTDALEMTGRLMPTVAAEIVIPVRNNEVRRRSRVIDALEKALRDRPIRDIAAVSPRIFFDPDHDRLVFADHESEVAIVSATEIDSIDVMPSPFLRQGISIARDGSRLGVAIPMSPPALHDPHDIDRIEAGVRALGNEHGLTIVMLCLRRPHTTTELGSLMHLTPAPVSRQLKRLEYAGLLTSRRRGRFVDYTTTIEACHILGSGISRLAETVNRAAADEVYRLRHP